MGQIIKTDEHYEYHQGNGDVTAWFEDIGEKMELSHEGSLFYKKVFYVLISLGVLYLLAVFTFVH